MRHRHGLRKLNRTTSHRLAMLRNMTISLLRTKPSRPPCPKPRNCAALSSRSSPWARPTLANKRLAFDRLRDREIVSSCSTNSARAIKRNGGYLRILKMGFRVGDNAPMAFVELVDRPDASVEASAADKAE